MPLDEDLQRIDLELDVIEGELIRLEARQAGLRAERDRLQAGVRLQSSLHTASGARVASAIRDLNKNDAIIAVLKQADHEMSIDEIVAALRSGGRASETYGIVAIYLSNLAKEGRIRRVRRGNYTA